MRGPKKGVKTQVKKTGVKILCSKSWEGQNSMKAKIWGSKFYFFLVEPLVKILCSLKRGGQNSIFFPSALKKGGQNCAAYTNQLHWRGAPPGESPQWLLAVSKPKVRMRVTSAPDVSFGARIAQDMRQMHSNVAWVGAWNSLPSYQSGTFVCRGQKFWQSRLSERNHKMAAERAIDVDAKCILCWIQRNPGIFLCDCWS